MTLERENFGKPQTPKTFFMQNKQTNVLLQVIKTNKKRLLARKKPDSDASLLKTFFFAKQRWPPVLFPCRNPL